MFTDQLQLFETKKVSIPFLPKEIFLRSLDRKFSIQYKWKPTSTIKLWNDQNTITLEGNFLRRTQIHQLLKRWLVLSFQKKLVYLLDECSAKTKISYRKAFVKNQKTRWASCSEHGNINLNIRLLFLPEHLMRHVMLHELCHIHHLNHSKDFWSLVGSFEPNYKAYEKELRLGRTYVPGWITRVS